MLPRARAARHPLAWRVTFVNERARPEMGLAQVAVATATAPGCVSRRWARLGSALLAGRPCRAEELKREAFGSPPATRDHYLQRRLKFQLVKPQSAHTGKPNLHYPSSPSVKAWPSQQVSSGQLSKTLLFYFLCIHDTI